LALIFKGLSYSITAKGHLRLAEQHINKGDYTSAIVELKKAIELNPYFEKAYYKLGLVYYTLGLYKEAEDSLKKAISLDIGFAEAYNTLCLTYEALDNLNEAHKIIEECLKHCPTDISSHYNLARILVKKGNLRSAVKEFERVLRLDPKHTLAYLNLGTLYRKEEIKNLDKAFAYYKKALECDPDNELIHLSIADLYVEYGWFRQAKDRYRSVLKLDPKNLHALKALTRVHLHLDEPKKAIPLYKRIIKLQDNDPLAYYGLGLAQRRLGKFKEALKNFELSLKYEPYQELAINHKEDLIVKLYPVSSLARIEQARYRSELGRRYFEGGNIIQAESQYKKTIRLNPQDWKTRFDLAKIYRSLGLFNLAIDEMSKVIELNPEEQEVIDFFESLYRESKYTLTSRNEIYIDELKKKFTVPKIALVKCIQKDVLHLDAAEQLREEILFYLRRYPSIKCFKIKTNSPFIKNDLGKILKAGRESGADFIVFGELTESEKDMEAKINFYSLRNFRKIFSETLYETGKHRLKELSLKIALKIFKNTPKEGFIIKVKGDTFFVNLGSFAGIKAGDIFQVYERGELKINPTTAESLLKIEKNIAKLKVIKTDALISEAVSVLIRDEKFIKINQRVRLVKEKKE
jgi:tetratricopeptide (TPR) repeat protein